MLHPEFPNLVEHVLNRNLRLLVFSNGFMLETAIRCKVFTAFPYDGIYDELKLAGRVTLRDPKKYLTVLDAYIQRKPLPPNEIGGGPASMLEPIDIIEEFFAQTLHCGHQCQTCTICQKYYQQK